MNLLERQMVDSLVDLRENHHVLAVKAEFESEGARVSEVLRLKEIALRAGLDLVLTIGGSEALYDLDQVRLIGAARVVGPMIESPYALKKYLSSVRRVFSGEERGQIAAWINVETIDACHAFDRMLALPEIDDLDGIVMGRVDLLGSMGLDRAAINSADILRLAQELFARAKAKALRCGIGGGVAAQALPFFRSLGPELLDHFESSKVLFECPGALGPGAELGLAKAAGFELLWLKSKKQTYAALATEDDQRIRMMQARYEAAMHKE
jgi:4-hydroxy-2-oxoheptanedioate aldolase